MAWNIHEYNSLSSLTTLLGSQKGLFSNQLKIYRTGENLVVAQYHELDHEVVRDFALGSAIMNLGTFSDEVFDHVEDVDDARRLIVQQARLVLAIPVLPGFVFKKDSSIEMKITQKMVSEIVGVPVSFS